MQFFVKPGTDEEWFEKLARRAHGVARGARASGPRSCASTSTGRTSWRTTPRTRTTSSTSSRSAGRSSRASTTAPTSTCRDTRSHSGQEARVPRPGDERALRPVRGRDVGRRRPHDAGGAGRRLPARRRSEGRARRAAAAPVARADQGGGVPARQQGRHAGARPPHSRRPARHFTCSTTTAARSAGATAGRTRPGTPFCITIDGQTTQDQTVTVRDRDTHAAGARRGGPAGGVPDREARGVKRVLVECRDLFFRGKMHAILGAPVAPYAREEPLDLAVLELGQARRGRADPRDWWGAACRCSRLDRTSTSTRCERPEAPERAPCRIPRWNRPCARCCPDPGRGCGAFAATASCCATFSPLSPTGRRKHYATRRSIIRHSAPATGSAHRSS